MTDHSFNRFVQKRWLFWESVKRLSLLSRWITRLNYLFKTLIFFRNQSSSCLYQAHAILAPIFTRRQVLRNRRQIYEIWENRQRVADTREIFVMLKIWTCWQFKIPLWNEFWLKKLIRPRASERARYRVALSFRSSYRLPNSFLLYYLLIIFSPFCCKSARRPFV